MTESASPRISTPRITVLGVQPGDPPFRLVEIDGEVVRAAVSITDVLFTAAAAGITVHDPSFVVTVRADGPLVEAG
ncbi:hypothetical protein [Streptomyces sp. NPDC057580]|uniref:hypothetical protein n=1 Tax=Streptomyces sp. NPDC057580 TaxID=3346173 RepID=UPI0036C1A9D5